MQGFGYVTTTNITLNSPSKLAPTDTHQLQHQRLTTSTLRVRTVRGRHHHHLLTPRPQVPQLTTSNTANTSLNCPLPHQIGTNASVDELKAVQHYLHTCQRRVEVVSPAWLLLCQQEQRLAPADTRCRLQLNSIMRAAAGITPAGSNGAAAGVTGVGSAGSGGGGGVFANTASRGGFPAGGAGGAGADKAAAGEAAWVPEYWKERPSDPLRLFDGCYFTLAAVQSHQSDHEKALGHIRCAGA